MLTVPALDSEMPIPVVLAMLTAEKFFVPILAEMLMPLPAAVPL